MSFHEFVGVPEAEMDDAAVAEAEAQSKAIAEAESQAYASVLHLEVPSLLLYLLLMGLLSAVLILSRESTYDYYLSDMVRETILRSELDYADTKIATTFDDIASLEDVYKFLRGPLLAALYVETSYAGTPLPPSLMRRVNDQNILVGSVRMQQVRVAANAACEVHETFRNANLSHSYIGECFADWAVSDAHQTTSFYGASKATTAPALCGAGGPREGTAECEPALYKWQPAAESGLGSFSGRQSTYDGSGYVVTLPTGAAAAKAHLAALEADGFLGPSTRALWIDFSLYNVNINRFVMARLLFERLASGAIRPSTNIRTLNLLWYDGSGIPLLLVAEGCLLLLVLFFIGLELHSMYTQGLADYWSDVSNWYDWPALTSFGLVAWLRFKTWSSMSVLKAVITEDSADGTLDAFVSFQAVGWWAGNEQVALSLVTLITYLKVLYFLAGVPHISSLLRTLSRAAPALSAFVFGLSLLIFAFAAAFHLAFGNDLYDWRGLGDACVSLLRFALGDVDVRALMLSSPVLGVILYLLFLFLVVLVAIAIFLAIITNAYAEERANATHVDLPKVLREAYRRQRERNIAWRKGVYYRFGAPLRAWRRWREARREARRRRAAGGGGGDDDSPSLSTGDGRTRSGGGEARRSLSGTSGRTQSAGAVSAHSIASGNAEGVAAMSEEDRAAAAMKHMERAREAMQGGHLFVLNEVATQLKSLCFRHDAAGGMPLRQATQAAMAELERLAAVNEALKSRALDEGWQWDLSTAKLHPTGRGAKVGAHDGLAADVDAHVRPELDQAARQAKARAAHEEQTLEALGLARSLAKATGADPADVDATAADLDQLRSYAAFQRAMAVDTAAAATNGGAAAAGSKHKHKHHKHHKHR